MKVLVPTLVGDEHARIICCAAAYQKNLQIIRWFTADYPCRQTLSIKYLEDHVQWDFKGAGLNSLNTPFDVVWLRRPVPPILPHTLHPEARATANRENAGFFKSLWYALADNAIWINNYPAHLAAQSKLLQLDSARKAGFIIPPTLISNDPQQIRAFVTENYPAATLYKSFFPAVGYLALGVPDLGEAVVVTEQNLPDANTLRLTPGIFQRCMPKMFEVRATFMGAHAAAVRLTLQSSWKLQRYRFNHANKINLQPVSLPPEIYRRCRAMMAKLGIIFGCFKFLVTPDEKYVFLELHEMGEFLWQEQLCPEARILEAFMSFLANPGFDFTWQPTGKAMELDALLATEAYQNLVEEELALHMESFPDAISGYFEAKI